MGAPPGTQPTDGYWKGEARRYASLYAPARRFSVKRFATGFLDARTTQLLSMLVLPPEASVLDLACGAGAHIALLAPRCREIVGVDYSQPMLALAEQQLSLLPVGNWSLRLADAHDLPFPEGRFDVVVSMGLLDYVVSPDRVLSECRRVTRPGGTVLFSIPKRPSLFAFLRTRMGNAIKRVLFGLPPVGNAHDRRELAELVARSGLRLDATASVWTTMWIVKATRHDSPVG